MDDRPALPAFAPRIKAYPVVAIFQIGISEFDGIFVYMPFEEAQAWYHSPEYADARTHRFKSADYRAIIVQGV